MYAYGTVFVVWLMFGSLSGSILNCCDQGQKTGSKQTDAPDCTEKNLDYKSVGKVSKGMCLKVFLSCCENSAMEQYCKLGIQSSINGIGCQTAPGLGGKMKETCCNCCNQGIMAANSGSCDGMSSEEMLCRDSFMACCSNAMTMLATTKAPKTSAPTKKVNCTSLGCEHTCMASGDAVNCECSGGYRLKSDRKSCQDIDECKEGVAVCDAGNFCQNTAGSYICVNPPEVKEKKCKKEGYIRNADGKCVDEDECATGTAVCRGNQFCVNADGYYACLTSCPNGYSPSGRICKDIDECALGIHRCSGRYTCENVIGNYNCRLSSCPSGFKLENGRCVDMNECEMDPNICGPGRCYNAYGGYTCGCYRGYRFDSNSQKCEDIDECSRSPGICESECINTPGSYRCSCPKGYQSIGNNCEDIDECSLFSNRCPSGHVCVNEYGNFTCINATCPGKYYIPRSQYECRLFCPGNYGKCSDMVIQSIKWNAMKFKKIVLPRQFRFSYTLRVSSYLRVQINFSLVSGNEGREFYLQRRSENTVDIINLKKLIGPKKYTLRLDADILYNGKITNKFIYLYYISVSKYSF